MSERIVSDEWLDLELERIWLAAEAELRRTRPVSAELESVLAERRAKRAGAAIAFEPAELVAAATRADERLAALRGAVGERMHARLGLVPSEIAALVIIAAPSIDPMLADLFAAIRGPSSRRGVDVALISQLLRCTREQRVDLLAILDDDRPAVAQRLIQVAPSQESYASSSYRAIQPTLDLLWLLITSGGGCSPSLRSKATIVRRTATWQGLLLEPAIESWLHPLAGRFAARDQLPWLALWGQPGSGKREIAARLAAHGRRPLLWVKPGEKAGLLDLVRRACRDAAWLDAVLYLGPFGAEDLHEQQPVIEILERCRVPLVLGFDATTPPRLKARHPVAEHALPVPQFPGRVALWRRAFAGVTLAPQADLARIAHNYKLTPGEIFDAARETASLAGDQPVDAACLRAVMERRLRNELGAVATRLVTTTGWNDVILPVEARGRLRELIARKQHEDRVYREWGLDRQIGYGKGIIALLSGPPGTGKTLLAGLIANELGLELYQIDLSQIFSRYLGETEKALERVFDQAERAHAVLLFDEADALFAKRTQVDDSHDRYANAAVNFLLQRLERYTGVAVLTTNKETSLDEALRRRLSLHLMIEEPEAMERLQLWQKHLPKSVPGSPTVDIARLAAELELTGGYIKNVAVRATFLCAAENVPLSTSQVRRAAHLELEDLGRVITWPDDLAERSTTASTSVSDVEYVDG